MSAFANEQPVFLATAAVSRREVQFARAALLVSAIVFAAVAPFAKTQLGPVAAFVPIYVACLVICDVITAVLLFGQFNFLQTRSLLVLACAYLFTAAMTASYVFMFPGLFTPTGLLGAGPQSTSAMYIFWHAGFPVLVIAYALLKSREAARAGEIAPPSASTRVPIFLGVVAVLAVVVGYTVFVTAGNGYLPTFLDGNHTSDLGHLVLSGDWLLSFAALVVLWRQRPHRVIDLWLMVVMCVWLFDLALAAILNAGRYDLGWYVGRVYGLLAASCLLAMLLIENGKHYARLVRMSAKLGEANDALEQLSLHDGLTGISNRRAFDTYLEAQVAIAHRHKRTLALVLCDVDAFKAYNDTYGHQAGDDCLKSIATALRSCARRPADMAARYGGEEFALILPDTDLAGAVLIAETARSVVARRRMPHVASPAGRHVTISGGVAVLLHKVETAEDLIAAADRALFEAKRTGRDRMVSAVAEVELKLA